MMCFASNATQSGRACHRKEAEKVFMDRGYRGHGMSDSQVFISSGVNARPKRLLKRRQTVEPVFGHIENNGLLGTI